MTNDKQSRLTGLMFVAEDPCGIVSVSGCRWPVGFDPTVPGGHLFCNADRDDMKSYCPHHEQMKVRRS